MKQPENMDSTDMTADRYVPTRDEIAAWAYAKLDELNLSHSDLEDVFECYIDPEGWQRYGGCDVYDAVHNIMDSSPDTIADALVEYEKESQ
jgi:hypothetical protein